MFDILPQSFVSNLWLMAHSHCTGPGTGNWTGNDGFNILCYVLFTLQGRGQGTGTGTIGFHTHPPVPSPWSLSHSHSWSRAV